MNGSSVICPECRQTIRNAVSVGDKYRCGACGASFTAADFAKLPPSLVQKMSLVPPAPSRSTSLVPPPPIPSTVPASARLAAQSYFGSVSAAAVSGSEPVFSGPPMSMAAASKTNRAPLGRLPQSASYGLAKAVAWAMVIFSVVSSGWTMSLLLNPQDIKLPPSLLGPVSMTSSTSSTITPSVAPTPPPPTPRPPPKFASPKSSRSSRTSSSPSAMPAPLPPPVPPPVVVSPPVVTSTMTPTMSKMKASQASVMQIAGTVLDGLQQLMLALLLVCAVSLMTRLDAKASWLAWRSEGLVGSVSEPPGSSLHFILPLCVAGGVWVYLSLSAGNVISGALASFSSIFNTSGLTVMFVGAGVLTFLMGLGCAEVRRFLWRMEQLGKALMRRKRGDEMAMGEPQQFFTQPDRPSSAKYMFGVLFFVLIIYVVVAWWLIAQYQNTIEMISNSGMMPSNGMIPGIDVATDDVSRQLWVMALTGFMGIVGGAYTTFRLSLHWSDMVHAWRWAARSVGPVQDLDFGSLSTGRVGSVGRIVSFGLMGLVGYFFFRILTVFGPMALFSIPAMIVFLVICVPLCAVCYVKWTAGLKIESFHWVGATSVFAFNDRESSPVAKWVSFLSGGVMLMIAIRVGIVLYEFYQGIAPFMGGITFDVIALFSFMILFVIAVGVLPVVWWALTVQDLNRASENLDAGGEVV